MSRLDHRASEARCRQAEDDDGDDSVRHYQAGEDNNPLWGLTGETRFFKRCLVVYTDVSSELSRVRKEIEERRDQL